MSHAAAHTAADDGRGTSPLRWWALGLAAATIFSSYYESDAIGPIADLLGRERGFTQSQIGDLTAAVKCKRRCTESSNRPATTKP